MQEDIIAIVEGDPVTRGDLEYSLEIAHRREDLSTAQGLDITHYINKIIGERLVVHEASRMGLDTTPEFREKMMAFLTRESVVRLHDEEIVQKVVVTDDDIAHSYRESYAVYTIDVIETSSRVDAETALKELQAGKSFDALSEAYPSTMPGKRDEGYEIEGASLTPQIRGIVSAMNKGEVSGIIESGNRFIIIKLLEKLDAPPDHLDRVKDDLKRRVRNKKIKIREDEYLAELHDRAAVEIEREILSAISFEGGEEARNRWINDNRPLADINGDVLTVGDFAKMLSSSSEEVKEKNLTAWIDRKIVDQEALSRHYEKKPDLAESLRSYENELLQREFVRKVIIPEISVSESEAQAYYRENMESYRKPARHKIQQITVNTEKEAMDILTSLQGGAAFSWLAREKSTDSYAAKGGSLGWKTLGELEKPVVKSIGNMKPGETSEVLKINSFYKIIRLQETGADRHEEYERVQTSIKKSLFNDKYQALYDEYVQELKKEATITIDEKIVNSYEEIFHK